MGWKFWQRNDKPSAQTWPQDHDSGVFRLTIEDVFFITARGTVVLFG
jgi:translation elongation factor EF-Tu-like GTPase